MFGFLVSCASAAFSAVSSFVGSCVSTIGSALSSFATGVGVVIGSVIDAVRPVAEALGRFANSFLQGLGVLQPGEKVDDLGERALQAGEQKGIRMENFENFSSYMDALRKFELNPEVAAKRSLAEKITAGLAVGTVGVEDKFGAERGSLNAMWLLPMTNPDYFTPERMQSLVSTGRLAGDVFAYLEKRLDGADASSFRKGLEITLDAQPMSETEQGTLYSALDSARNQWAELAQQVQAKYNGPSGASA